MIDLAHEDVQLFLAFFAFGDVRDGADNADGPSVMPVALKMNTAQGLYPPDLAVYGTEPELISRASRVGGIQHFVKSRPKSFHIIRMHPIDEFFGGSVIRRDAQDFFGARIPGKDPEERVVLPRPEPGCVKGML
jgi:hypothetical protein